MPTFLVRANAWNRARCRGCGAPITWAVTAAGARMPLDRLDVTATDPEQPWMLRVESADTHRATCPKRELFETPKGVAT